MERRKVQGVEAKEQLSTHSIQDVSEGEKKEVEAKEQLSTHSIQDVSEGEKKEVEADKDMWPYSLQDASEEEKKEVFVQTKPVISKIGLSIVVTISLLVYWITSFPSLTAGDSGELLSAACTLGVAHPPGYPLFVWMNNIAMHIGDLFGLSPARSGNLLAVLLSSVSNGFIYATIETCTDGDIFSAIFGSFMAAFSPLIWLYSIQAEVFSLNNLIISILLFLIVCFFKYSKNYAFIGAFMVGIAATNQHTSVFVALPAILSVMMESPKFVFNNAVYFGICFAAGFFPYIQLPLASIFNSKARWGDQRTLAGFLKHFLRREYGTFQLASSQIAGNVPYLVRLLTYFADAYRQTLVFGAILAFFAMYQSIRGNLEVQVRNTRKALFVFLVSFFLYVLVFHFLNNLDHRPILLGVQMRFWIQPNILLFIFSGIGLHVLFKNLKIPPIYKRIFVCLAVVYQIASNASNSNRSNEDIFAKFAKMHLDHMPANSIVLVNGDTNHYSFNYVHLCEKVRVRDVDVVSLDHMSFHWFKHQYSNYPNVKFPKPNYNPFSPDGYNFVDFLRANEMRPIYICGKLRDDDPTTKGTFEMIAVGMCQRLLPRGSMELMGPEHKFDFFHQGYLSVPSITELGGYHPVKHSIYTWESKLFRESYFALIDLFISISIHTEDDIMNYEEQLNLSSSFEGNLIILGRLVCDKLVTYFDEPFLFEMRKIDAMGYKVIGMFYGKNSQIDESMAIELEREMFFWWKKYVKLQPEDKEISRFVDQKINPYRESPETVL